jgi:hypothetical protein
MTRWFCFFFTAAMAVCSLLSAGCDDPVADDDMINDDDDDGGGDDDECEDCFATFHIVVPYGWTGDVYVTEEDDPSPDLACEGVTECEVGVPTPDTEEGRADYKVQIEGWNFICVLQKKALFLEDAGEVKVLDSIWTEPAQCGLAPNGEYEDEDGNSEEVETEEKDKEIVIDVGYSCVFPVTSNSFSGPCGDNYLDVGIISDELHEVYYHMNMWDGNEFERTLTLD